MILQAPEPGIVLALPSAPEQEAAQWNASWTYQDRLVKLFGVNVEVSESSPRHIAFSIPAESTCIPMKPGIEWRGNAGGKTLLLMSVELLNRMEDRAEYINSKFSA